MKFRFSISVLLILTINSCAMCLPSLSSIFRYKHYPENELEFSENSVVEDAAAESVTDQALFTDLRIEYIKTQILKKLRLKEKPTISLEDRRKSKEYENLLGQDDDHPYTKSTDDFYGKTTQAILFPTEDEVLCSRKGRFPSACLPFQLPRDIHATDVSLAELWFHKKADNMDSHNQTFIVSEAAHWDTMKSFQKNKPIAIQETSLTEDWIKVDLTLMVKNWLEDSETQTHAIQITCKTCGMHKSKSPISFQQKLKPFLMIHTHQQRTLAPRRSKRSLECGPGVNECCRESLYISFVEVGWDDWILKPKGYNAYFCKGSCNTAASASLSASGHNGILQIYMNKRTEDRNARPELTTCCAATQFNPLQLVYMDNNKTVTTKLLSNMIVGACGCM